MNKDRLIVTLIHLFNEKGILFTIDELADKLKVSKKTIYKNYNSKEELIELIIDESFKSIEQQTKALMEDDSMDIIEKIKEMICVYPRFNIKYEYIEDILNKYPNVYRKIGNALDNTLNNTSNIIKQAVHENKMKDIDISSLKLILVSINKEILTLSISEQKTRLRACVDLILDQYRI